MCIRDSSTTNSNYGTGGQNVVITGSGFNSARKGDNDLEEISLGTTVLAADGNITYNSDAQLTVQTLNNGSSFSGQVKYRDNQCNCSTSTGSNYRHDDTNPSFTSVDVTVVNGGGQAIVSGAGFAPSSIQTGLKTVEIGATELAIAYWDVNADNQITITGPNADIAAAALALLLMLVKFGIAIAERTAKTATTTTSSISENPSSPGLLERALLALGLFKYACNGVISYKNEVN